MIFIFGIFQFHCKSDHKQVKWNKIKQGLCKSDRIFPYLQSSALFKRLLKFILRFFSKMNHNSLEGEMSLV